MSGLRRVLNETLGMERTVQVDWEIEQTCLGTWFRPSFEPCLFPYTPSHVKTPKERRQIFLGSFFFISLDNKFYLIFFISPIASKPTIWCTKKLQTRGGAVVWNLWQQVWLIMKRLSVYWYPFRNGYGPVISSLPAQLSRFNFKFLWIGQKSAKRKKKVETNNIKKDV